MGKKTESLVFQFGVIFAIFTFVMLFLSGGLTYYNQNKAYKEEREKSLKQIASYLYDVLNTDGMDFVYYQDYFLSHTDTLLVPHNFGLKEIQKSRNDYEKLFASRYPEKVLGTDIKFEELDDDVKAAFTTYKHEYYLYKFEQARSKFNIIYIEYVVPNENTLEVCYTLDALRDERIVDGKKYIELGITVTHSLDEHKKEWEAWNTGKVVEGFDTFDNEYGKTYAYYLPVIIKGQKLGLIGCEVEIAKVNKAIAINALREIGAISVILIICVIFLLTFIYKRYISKLEHLKKSMKDYSESKNASIASEIEKQVAGKDEISVLALQASSMILELENYMKSLLKTAQELRDTQQKADNLSELAIKDALTGIRNKTAYDEEVKKLEWKMSDENLEFGIAMIDLNFLKKINDTFGHDKGNIAIKKLCYIVCHVFEHSPVFRIGGDEFVVILQNGDFEKRDSLYTIFNSKLDSLAAETDLEPWEKVSASIGIAVYDKLIDSNVDNVFKRADKAMYLRKKEMKCLRDM